MNIEEFYAYCLQKKGVSEHFPFDEQTLVFKIGTKIFALTDVTSFRSINLKCNPEKAIELREEYAAVQPGYHMNKKHWNTIILFSDLDDQLLKELIDHSYNLVLNSLPKKIRDEIALG
ncbi:MAG: MmcQ/YjbR family DNA-binding protein [Crocinitomicaceae bacterium]|jgi:predicted DNA-binding protein (MmcQ/YjbR family)